MSATNHRRLPAVSLAFLFVSLAAIVIGVATLSVGDVPDGDSPETGFMRDLLEHDATARAAIDALDCGIVATDIEDILLAVSDETMRAGHSAVTLLMSWHQPSAIAAPAMSWMGHVAAGTTPGAIGTRQIQAMGSLDCDERPRQLLALLSAHLRGSILMGRGLLALGSSRDAVDSVATMIDTRRELLDHLEAWFIGQGQMPPTWIAPMTTDPGELDHGDPVTSLGAVTSAALRWLPFAIAIAAACLIRPRPERASRRPAVWAAAAASSASGLGHFGVVSAHAKDSLAAGAFFIAVGAAQIIVAALLFSRPSSSRLNGLASVSAVLTIIYVFFRILPPPGSVGPADVDLAGLVIVGCQLLAIAVWAARPFGNQLGRFGLDGAVRALRDGIAGATLAAVLAASVLVGLIVGERDAFPPSEIDAGFAADMVLHHDQAVQMSLIVDGRLSNPAIEGFAREVIMSQRTEIGVLQTRLRLWGQAWPDGSGPVMDWMGMPMPLDEMPGIASRAQLAALRAAEGPELDAMFLALMANHHIGGVQMAAFASENADDFQLVELATRIRSNQLIEIREYAFTMRQLGLEVPQGSLTLEELLTVGAVATGGTP